MQGWKQRVWGWAAAAALLAGCVAHGPPPQELLDAREAYQRASASTEVKQVSADELTEAWHALLEAEREYDRSKHLGDDALAGVRGAAQGELAETLASISVWPSASAPWRTRRWPDAGGRAAPGASRSWRRRSSSSPRPGA